MKRSGDREPFDRAKVVAGLVAATKGRPVDADAARASVGHRGRGGAAPRGPRGAHRRGRAARCSSACASSTWSPAVRFASVYKEFDDLADFERELTELTHSALTKATEPKRH